jgi:hypothetical protein
MHGDTSGNLLLVNADAIETEVTTRKLGSWRYKSVLATKHSNETSQFLLRMLCLLGIAQTKKPEIPMSKKTCVQG